MRKGKMYVALAAAVMLTISGGVTLRAADTVLDTVYVNADRDGEVVAAPGGLVNETAKLGILGNQSVMDIPYTEMSMTQKTLEKFDDPSQPIANVLMNNPSIRTSTTSPMYTDFSMRGINMNGNHMMLNGVPSLFYQFNGPISHYIDRIDITSGPNAGINGVSMSNNGTNSGATPAPGTINVVTKRAGSEPVTKFTETFSGRSNLGEFIDVARRAGKDNEWGIRVMGEYMEGGLALKGAEKNEKNIFVNLDRKGKTSNTNFFVGHFDLRVNEGQRWFSYGGKSSELPSAPDSNIPYDFKGTTKWMHGWMYTFNHEKTINDHVTWFTNIGHSARSGNKYNTGSAPVFDENGNFMNTKKDGKWDKTNAANSQNEIGTNTYFQTGVSARFETGAVKHQASLAIDRSWAKYWNKSENGPKGLITGGIYTGPIYAEDFYTTIKPFAKAALQWDEVNTGITVADSVSYGKWDLLLAASHKHENFTNVQKGNKFQNDDWLPTYGITYKPNENMAIYVSQTESVSRGAIVTNDASNNKHYDNAGETIEPSTSKQREVGVKYKFKNLVTTLSYFDIETECILDKNGKNGLLHRAIDGKDNYKGWEWTINGKPADKWTVTGGLLYMNGKREKTDKGKYDGWYINGASKWSTVVGAVYEPNDKWSIIGRLTWVGDAHIDNSASPTKSTRIPAYTVLDLGFDYKTSIADVPVTFKAMCYNALNKDYWMGRGSSTTFGLSMPRTWMLSASMSF